MKNVNMSMKQLQKKYYKVKNVQNVLAELKD